MAEVHLVVLRELPVHGDPGGKKTWPMVTVQWLPAEWLSKPWDRRWRARIMWRDPDPRYSTKTHRWGTFS